MDLFKMESLDRTSTDILRDYAAAWHIWMIRVTANAAKVKRGHMSPRKANEHNEANGKAMYKLLDKLYDALLIDTLLALKYRKERWPPLRRARSIPYI